MFWGRLWTLMTMLTIVESYARADFDSQLADDFVRSALEFRHQQALALTQKESSPAKGWSTSGDRRRFVVHLKFQGENNLKIESLKARFDSEDTQTFLPSQDTQIPWMSLAFERAPVGLRLFELELMAHSSVAFEPFVGPLKVWRGASVAPIFIGLDSDEVFLNVDYTLSGWLGSELKIVVREIPQLVDPDVLRERALSGDLP